MTCPLWDLFFLVFAAAAQCANYSPLLHLNMSSYSVNSHFPRLSVFFFSFPVVLCTGVRGHVSYLISLEKGAPDQASLRKLQYIELERLL